MPHHPPLAYVEPAGSALDRGEVLGHVVRAMLDVAVDHPRPRAAVVESDDEWRDVWGALCRHRIESFVPPSIADGSLRIPESALAAVAERARRVAVGQLRLTVELRRLVVAMDDAGVELRVLKGLATGRLDHREAAHRRTSDIDVLVRPEQFERACAVVAANNATGVRDDKPARLLVERTFRATSGVEIDVHHRLFRFGPAGDDVLFADPEPLPDVLGLALSREARLMHASAHLLISPPGHRQMSSLFDVAALVAAPATDVDRALRLADRFGVRDVVRFACWLADEIGVADPAPPPTFPGTLVNRAHLRSNRRADLETLAVLADLGGGRDRIAYLRFLLGRRPKKSRVHGEVRR